MAEYFYGITDKGKRRERNEDTFFVREVLNKQYIVACVIDGVGGYKGGDVAAAIARSVIIKKLERITDNVIENLQEAIVAANEKINREKKTGDKNERMACVLTCAVVDVRNNKFWYAHVGDTRIYLMRDQSLIKISSDHSAVGFLEESGRLSEEEAMRHPRRNEINKALGFEEDIATAADFIETGESPFLPGDMLLLCSDGLTDMISSAKIISVLTPKKTLSTKTKALVDAANDAGGNDNITAVLVEHNQQPKQKIQPVPVERKKDAASQVAALLTAGEKEPGKKNNRNGVVLLVLLFTGILMVALAVAFNKNVKPKAVMPAPAASKTNEAFLQLLSHINASGKKYELPEKGIVIKVPAVIVINKDSFQLKGNGSVLQTDSLKGPALIINSTAKHVVLDSVVFQNFDVAILLQRNNLTLRNVRFVNCRVPVQYAVSFKDSLVSGKFKDSIFINQSKQP
jgi:serine/threonine protein phosphatase PrpC